MKTSCERILPTRKIPKNARFVYGMMLGDWLDTICVNGDLSNMDEDGNITIKFSSPEDRLMFELKGLPNHLDKFIIKSNTKF